METSRRFFRFPALEELSIDRKMDVPPFWCWVMGAATARGFDAVGSAAATDDDNWTGAIVLELALLTVVALAVAAKLETFL